MRAKGMEKKVFIFSVVILSLCSIVPVWIVTYFPSVNGPAFLHITHMFNEMNNPAFCYSDYFMRHLHYMPYLSVYSLLYFFSHLFSVFIAQKIVLSLIVLAFPLSIFYFLKNIAPEKMVFGFPGYLIVYNFNFMRSYNNYMLAVILFFVFLGYWQSIKQDLNWKRVFILNMLLLTIFLSHIIVVLFLLFILFLFQILENKSVADTVKHMIVFAAPTLISIIYFLYFTHANSIWQQNEIVIENWPFKLENIYLRFLWPYSHTGRILALIPFLIVLFTIVLKIWGFIFQYIHKDKISLHNSMENRMIIILTIILSIYFLAPWKFIGWHKADIRFVPFLYIFMLACGQPFHKEWQRTGFVLMTSALAIMLYIHIGNQCMKLDQEIKHEYLAGIEHIQKNKKMLPMTIGEKKFEVINPYAHLFDYYGIYRGAITGRSLAAYNTISPVWYKDYKEFPHFSKFPSFDPESLDIDKLQRIKKAYDYVLIWGNNKAVEGIFRNNGFKSVFEKKRLHIFEPEDKVALFR